MKWRTKREPHECDRRTIRRFAWLPTSCAYHKTVWLEQYYVLQEYSKVPTYLVECGYSPGIWHYAWCDLEKWPCG
jgi:hypothetical protein